MDIENFEMGCNKCNQVWRLESNTFYCSCGHVQRTEYADSSVVVEVGDEVIATDGEVVYLLRRTGEIVVGQREYFDVDWD